MSGEGPAVRDPRRVFAATAVGVVAVFLNMSGLAVALPTITRELGAGPGQADWILLGYMLVSTALILVFGRIADLVGRRRLYLAGLVVFTAATGLAALSPSAEFLIAARVVQGVGAAAVITNNTALLTDVFPARALGRALGWNVTVASVAQIAGPVVGGAATQLLGWRGLFVVCVPIGLVAIVASTLAVPPSGGSAARRSDGVREPFDLLGALLSVATLTVLVLALTPGATATVAGWLPWACGSAAVALFAVLAVVQTRRPYPLVDVALLRTRATAVVFAAVLASAVSSYAVVLLASMHEQAVGGATSLEAGLLVTPVAVGTLLTSAAAGSLFGRFTPRALTTAGMAVTACGLLGFSLMLSSAAVPFWAVAPFLFLIGAGTGLFMTPSTGALMLAVPADRRGVANGLRSTTQNVGYLLSTALALAFTTTGLSEAARHAAYEGTLNTLNVLASGELSRFVANIRVTGFVLTGIAVAGGAICLAFPTSLRHHTKGMAMTGSQQSPHSQQSQQEDYERAGFDGELIPGTSPALLLVDPARAYVDPDCPLYAGVEPAVEAMRVLLADARRAGVPVIVTRVLLRADGSDGGVFFRKVPLLRAFTEGSPFGEFIDGLAPTADELTVTKQYPSAFFGTELAAHLTADGIDTLLIGGLSTSGCVRATALDAMQHGFIPVVVEEAVGDRDPDIHAANLFDIKHKIGEVWPLGRVQEYLEKRGEHGMV